MMRAAIFAREASTKHYQEYSCFRIYFSRCDICCHCAAGGDHIWLTRVCECKNGVDGQIVDVKVKIRDNADSRSKSLVS